MNPRRLDENSLTSLRKPVRSCRPPGLCKLGTYVQASQPMILRWTHRQKGNGRTSRRMKLSKQLESARTPRRGPFANICKNGLGLFASMYQKRRRPFPLFFPSNLLSSPYFCSSLPVVTQIRGHIAGISNSPPPPPKVGAFCLIAISFQRFVPWSTRVESCMHTLLARRNLLVNFCLRKKVPW